MVRPDDVKPNGTPPPVSKAFYSGNLVWYFYAGLSGSLQETGHATSQYGGTVDSVTVCVYNQSFFKRSFTLYAYVSQSGNVIQSIPFTRLFPSGGPTCHRVNGFNAAVEPGEYQVGAGYVGFTNENFWAGLSVAIDGDTFDVQVNSSRPPLINGVRVKGIGISYSIEENRTFPGYGCVRDANTLCLGDSRFKAQVDWRNQFSGAGGRGIALPRSPQAGFFAFDNASNVELILKILDFGDAIKVFYGQLTDLQFAITITDLKTGAVEVYSNNEGGECGGIDQDAFKSAKYRARINRLIKAGPVAAGACVPSSSNLCLLDNRFKVTATWYNQFNGASGNAGAIAYTNLAGLLHYGDPNNVELLVKTLDFGGGQILFLYGALSDLGYTITLTDTTTGGVKTYDNPPGNYCGGIDNDAF